MRYARAHYLLSCLARFHSLYPHSSGDVSRVLGRPTGSPFGEFLQLKKYNRSYAAHPYLNTYNTLRTKLGQENGRDRSQSIYP